MKDLATKKEEIQICKGDLSMKSMREANNIHQSGDLKKS